MVETGRAAAFIMDDVLLAPLIASALSPDQFELSTKALSKPEPYAFMQRKNDTLFKAMVDEATAKILTGPWGRALYERWFTQPISPRQINLNLPLSAEMRKQFAKPIDSPDPDAY